jgi:hypothetical protein
MTKGSCIEIKENIEVTNSGDLKVTSKLPLKDEE